MSERQTAHLPIRIDLVGGWTDQAAWRGPAAVVNGAFGWEGAGYGPKGLYPLSVSGGEVHSRICGVGTGLGISSIRVAGKALASGEVDYLAHSAAFEQEQGTLGGWQDALGALEPGFKLLRRGVGEERPAILRNDAHAILDHLVLFDTGIRRPSQIIGDQVRAKFSSAQVSAALETAAGAAGVAFRADRVDTAAQLCLGGWAMLTRLFPAMAEGLPANAPEAWGQKYCGAGGGGYGVAFARTPGARGAVIAHYRRLGLWAQVPILLDGACVEVRRRPGRPKALVAA